jgi:hypothetical protein
VKGALCASPLGNRLSCLLSLWATRRPMKAKSSRTTAVSQAPRLKTEDMYRPKVRPAPISNAARTPNCGGAVREDERQIVRAERDHEGGVEPVQTVKGGSSYER